MKKLVLIIIICLGYSIFLEAQSSWKYIGVEGSVLGVGPDGNIYANNENGKLSRSQDEGATWQIVLGQETGFSGFVNHSCFAVSNEGRICVFNDDQQTVVYSDDGGDTWQQTTSLSPYCAFPTKTGIYAVTNDIVVVWAQEGEILYSLDGGETWNGCVLEFVAEQTGNNSVSDLLVGENGDVYISVWSNSGEGSGIYHSTLSDMNNWELVAFENVGIKNMEFDPDGNVMCGVSFGGEFSGFEHVPGFFAFGANTFGIADNGILYKLVNTPSNGTYLAYSLDHGEHFTEIIEPLPFSNLYYNGGDRISKGCDNHLYYVGEGGFYKSIPDANVFPDYNPWVGEKFYDTISGFYYKVTDYNTAKVTYFEIGSNTYSGNREIPASVEYQGRAYTVTAIGDHAFDGCANLVSVDIPGTVTSIGERAFSLSGLESISLPQSAVSIGEKAFFYCRNLESVILSDAITDIPSETFSGCTSLVEVTLPSHLESIGQRAFGGCSALPSLNLPDGLHTIGERAFNSSGLTSIDIPNSVTTVERAAFDQCESLEEVRLSESMTVIEPCLFYNCGNLRSVSIPSQLIAIRSSAFYQCFSLEEVSIPNTVTTIETGAFYFCRSLHSVSIPSNVTTLGAAAFSDCYTLSCVLLPSELDTIKDYLFMFCHSLAFISIPESVVSIGESAFYGCDSLHAVFIPRNVDTIGSGAFSYCHSLETIEIDQNNSRYKVVDGVLFNNSKTILMQYPAGLRNSSYSIPASVTMLDSYSFAGASHLTGITIPNPVETIGSHAFFRCNGLRSVTIPTGTIGMNAFHGCENLSTAYIGPSVDWISSQAFFDCRNLSLVVLGNSNATIGSEAFRIGYANANMTIVCLSNSPGHNINSTAFPYIEDQEVMIVPCGQRDVYYNGWNYEWQSCNFEDDCNHYSVSIIGNEGGNILMTSTNSALMGDEITCSVTLEPNYMLKTILAYKADDETLKVPVVDNKIVMPNFDVVVKAEFMPLSIGEGHPEWYYEIENLNGSITYQHLEYASDTTVNHKDVTIIIRTNTLYDKGESNDVTREYLYEEDNVLYWWNKDLEEFTVLYDFGAEAGDEWEIKVGTERLTIHVDEVGQYDHDGHLFKILQVSDADNIFSGTIVCGIGHLTSFFPERLMTRGKGYRVEGMRCYWRRGELLYKNGGNDCDDIYEKYHQGLDEPSDTPAISVYPNPTHSILFVETVCTPSLPGQTYRITNLMGQTLMTGNITAETQQIDVSKLPKGMYFISIGDQTCKFVVR